MVDLVLQTGQHRRPQAVRRDRPWRGSQAEDPVLEAPDPATSGRQDIGREMERRPAAVVDEIRPAGVPSDDDHGVAEMARHRVGQAPETDRLEVDRGDDRSTGVQPRIERCSGALRSAGLVVIGFDLEPLQRLARPAREPRVLPLVPEPERQDRLAEGPELPEDVARPEPTTDAEDRGLGQGLAGQARDDALVRQDIGQGRGLGVQAAAHPVARRRGCIVGDVRGAGAAFIGSGRGEDRSARR